VIFAWRMHKGELESTLQLCRTIPRSSSVCWIEEWNWTVWTQMGKPLLIMLLAMGTCPASRCSLKMQLTSQLVRYT